VSTPDDLSKLFNEPIDQEALKEILARESRRVYQDDRFHPVGQDRYPSVTSVLGATLRAPALEHWKLKNALAAYRETVTNLLAGRDTKAALAMLQQVPLIARSAYSRRDGQQDDPAEIGTRLHKAIEWALRGELGQDLGRMPDLRPIDAGCFARWSEWWGTSGYRVLAVEVPLVCRACGFAGHADALVEEVSTGDPLVVDWKSSKEAYASYRLQLAAYAHCSPPTRRGAIVRIGKNEDEDVEVHHLEDLSTLFPLFKSTLDLWRWQRALEGYDTGTEPTGDHAGLTDPHSDETPPATVYAAVAG
jgi:hypothetical protein